MRCVLADKQQIKISLCILIFSWMSTSTRSINNLSEAAPKWLNPELNIPTPTPTPTPPQEQPITSTAADLYSETGRKWLTMEELITSDRSNFDVKHRWNQTLLFEEADGRSWYIRTGLEYYLDYENGNSFQLIPLHLGTVLPDVWNTELAVETGFDFSDKGYSTPFFRVAAPVSISDVNYSLDTEFECRAYRFNATTLTNRVNYCRGGPNFFWPISEDLSTFVSYRWGLYSDENSEHQSFARLNQSMGEFNLAGNVFSWTYDNDPDSGYFSPSDFLVVLGELGFNSSISPDLSCGLVAQLGAQRLDSSWSDARTVEGQCRWQQSDQLNGEVLVRISDVLEEDTSTYSNTHWRLHLGWNF